MIGTGRYDDECTAAREAAEAEGAILLVLNGKRGSGFSAQLPADMTIAIPDVLRSVAAQIEADAKALARGRM